jgi:nitrilase
MKYKKEVKVGVVQATPALFDIAATVKIIVSWIEKAVAEGCELLLFPESFIPCYPRGLRFDAIIGKRTEKSRNQWLDYWENSIETSSEYIDEIGAAIQKAGLFVALGVTEKESIGGSLHCSLLYFNKDGKLIGKHRKIKPTGL